MAVASPVLAPVRGVPAPVVAPVVEERSRKLRRPPRPSLAVMAILSLLALAGWGWFATSLVPRPHGAPLRAPVSRTLAGACVTDPTLCGAPVPSAP